MSRFLTITRPYGHTNAGHQQVDLEQDLDLARQLFETALGQEGMVAIQAIGQTKEVVREFDPDAEAIWIIPRIAGG